MAGGFGLFSGPGCGPFPLAARQGFSPACPALPCRPTHAFAYATAHAFSYAAAYAVAYTAAHAIAHAAPYTFAHAAAYTTTYAGTHAAPHAGAHAMAYAGAYALAFLAHMGAGDPVANPAHPAGYSGTYGHGPPSP